MTRLPEAPGPNPGLLGLRLASRFKADPLTFLAEMVREYGPLVKLRFGPQVAFIAAGPEAVEQVLVAGTRVFRKQRRNLRAVRQIDGLGIIATEGDCWLRQRRLVQKGFAPGRLTGYAQVTTRRTMQMLRRWPANGEVEICAEMTHLTLETIAETMFSVDMADRARELAEQVEYLSERLIVEMGHAIPQPDWLPIAAKRKKRAALRALHAMVREVVENRRRELQDATRNDRGDMLSMLLLAVDTEGDGSRMTDQQVCDEITTLFVAGYDTTASGLAWTWYLLAQNPEVAERAADEARGVLGSRPAGCADAERLPYLRQVLQESLRLYPPAWLIMLREAVGETELLGYRVPKRSWIYLAPWATQRSERWFVAPLRFDPERFSPARLGEMAPHAYAPFGLGPHRCVGEKLAMLEMTLILAMVLRDYRLMLAKGQGPVVAEPHTAIRPRGGLRLRVDRRG